MGLIEDLAAAKPNRGGQLCTVKVALDRMDDATREAVEAAIYAAATPDRLSENQVAVLLQQNGYKVSGASIGNHRRRQCATCR